MSRGFPSEIVLMLCSLIVRRNTFLNFNKEETFLVLLRMCVHNCWFFPSSKGTNLFLISFQELCWWVKVKARWLRAVPETVFTVLFSGGRWGGMRRVGWGKLLKINIYLNPLRNIFHFFKLQYSINLSYFFFGFSLSCFSLLLAWFGQQRKHQNCYFLFHFESNPWQWNFIFHNRNEGKFFRNFHCLRNSFLSSCVCSLL